MSGQEQHSNVPFRLAGFTLLELIAAVTILVVVMGIAFQAFTGTIRGWKRGTEVMNGIHHGDFSMNQMAAALRSIIYFNNPRKTYAFRLEKNIGTDLPADRISFVTSSRFFMSVDSTFAQSPHRIQLFIDEDEDGNPSLHSLVMPAIADEEQFIEEYAAEPHLVSRAVRGLEVLVWNGTDEEWEDQWELENSIPERLLLSLYVVASDEDEPPIVFSRTLDLPTAESVKEAIDHPSTPRK